MTEPTGPLSRKAPPAMRLFGRTHVVADTGCWVYVASPRPDGYAQIGIDRKRVYVHRLAWELLRGPIPAGMELDHLCRNRLCVNPNHLEPVTHRENTLRGETLARANAAKTVCPQGHEYALVGYLDQGRRRCRICRRAYERRLAARAAVAA